MKFMAVYAVVCGSAAVRIISAFANDE